MHTEWWNEPENVPQMRGLWKDENISLRAMENGHTIKSYARL